MRVPAKRYPWDPSEKKWLSGVSYDWNDSKVKISFKDLEDGTKLKTIRPSDTIKLSHGGTIKVWRKVLSEDCLAAIKNRMLNDVPYKQYGIQGGFEPRLHTLFHEDATHDTSEPQPGYCYGSTRMKGSPLSDHDWINSLSSIVAGMTGVDKWEIGVNPILYRGNKDNIGKHSDRAQAETNITTAIIEQESDRIVVIEPKDEKFPKEEWGQKTAKIKLFLGAGDIYSMDGEMQENYVHSVPKRKSKYENEEVKPRQRLVIVFRDGRRVMVPRDNGVPVAEFNLPKTVSYTFGQIDGLSFASVHSRTELKKMKAFQLSHRSISGSAESGVDAVILAGGNGDDREWDAYCAFVHSAQTTNGARALQLAYDKQLKIRVFRSSAIDNSIRHSGKKKKSQLLRYDGLYTVLKVQKPPAEGDRNR